MLFEQPFAIIENIIVVHMKSDLKEKAINLRRRGFSYSEVLKQIPVAKSTLSLWLRSIGLSKRQRQRLTERKLAAMRRGAQRKHEIRVEKSLKIKERAKKEAEALIKNPLWLIGTILYWGEGTKEKKGGRASKISFSNMDLEMHKLFLTWLKQYLKIPEADIRYDLYIHEKADIEKAEDFWIKNLSIKIRFPVYLKKHNPKTKRKNTGENYNGVLRIWVIKSSDLNRKIAGWIEGVIEYFK